MDTEVTAAALPAAPDQPVDAYATHLTVLAFIGALVPVQTVLEFGAGRYSTPAFLNREWFPHVVRVYSIETDPAWSLRAGMLVGKDPRWSVSGGIHEQLIAAFDLVFIDNGRAESERVPVIEAVSWQRADCLVVIHDFEREAYRRAADFDWCVVYDKQTPHTAVCWNGDRTLLKAQLETAWQ